MTDKECIEKRELSFAKELSTLLSPFGLVRIEYLTAEFEPFSAQQRPDVVFIPSSGAYANTTAVIEIRFPRNATILRGSIIQIPDRKDFVAEALNVHVSAYICILDVEVPEFSKELLVRQGIRIIDKVSDPRIAADALRNILCIK